MSSEDNETMVYSIGFLGLIDIRSDNYPKYMLLTVHANAYIFKNTMKLLSLKEDKHLITIDNKISQFHTISERKVQQNSQK